MNKNNTSQWNGDNNSVGEVARQDRTQSEMKLLSDFDGNSLDEQQ